MMAKVAIVPLLILCAKMRLAQAAMYEANTIRLSDFIIAEEVKHLTSDFMCSIGAGKKGYKAFRINGATGACEMGDLDRDAEQSPVGIRVYVESGAGASIKPATTTTTTTTTTVLQRS